MNVSNLITTRGQYTFPVTIYTDLPSLLNLCYET